MRKKLSLLLLSALLILPMSACGRGVNGDAVYQENRPDTSVTAQTDTSTSDINDSSDASADTEGNDDANSAAPSQAPSSAQISEDSPKSEDTSKTEVSKAQTGSASADKRLTVTALKAGSADAFILMTDNHVTLIDTGLNKKSDRLIDFLKDENVKKVDEMIITHFDKDHVGGADQVLYNFEVGTVYTTYYTKESDQIDEFLKAMDSKGMTEDVVREVLSYEADGVSFTIYPPLDEDYTEKPSNNSSLVIRVCVGENSMLFTGDAEALRIFELLGTEGLQSTILKVPHHGRYSMLTEALIEYVSPKYAIISSGNSDPEDSEVVSLLKKHKVTTYLTREGNITITMTPDEVSISQ